MATDRNCAVCGYKILTQNWSQLTIRSFPNLHLLRPQSDEISDSVLKINFSRFTSKDLYWSEIIILQRFLTQYRLCSANVRNFLWFRCSREWSTVRTMRDRYDNWIDSCVPWLPDLFTKQCYASVGFEPLILSRWCFGWRITFVSYIKLTLVNVFNLF